MEIYEQGVEEYPKAVIVFGNFMMVLWIVVGTIACWFLFPLAAWLYLVFAVIMVVIVLRKLVCPNCYYYGKWCHIGWGKLSALMFKKGNIEDFRSSTGLKLAPITYGLLTIIPLILIVISIFRGFLVSELIVLILLLLISFYSGGVSRKKTCADCKMKIICPGSAANPQTDI